MKILLVNTSERIGGAAVATFRLMEALNNNGEKAKMLVRDKQSDNISVINLRKTFLNKWYFLWERWCIFWNLRFSKQHLFDIDIANAGTDITTLPEFKAADVIHLSWINQGMLSLNTIRKIVQSGKPIVWTMHDAWPATGICHLSMHCNRFKSQCNHCFYLPGKGSEHDLSTRIWNKKKEIYQRSNIHFVACSKWLAAQARQSGLLKGLNVFSIPNPIDTHIFTPKDREEACKKLNLPTDKKFILFASQRITNANKGIQYLIEACNQLTHNHSQRNTQWGIIVLGGHAEEVASEFQLPTYPLGYVDDTSTLVDVYNAASVFVLPSLSENLPNTIMEAMACGTPCIGFNVGGIPEEIDHKKNGYVAEYMNANDLAKGIQWILEEADYNELSKQAIRKVTLTYSQNAVALKYIEVYSQAIAFKKYRI